MTQSVLSLNTSTVAPLGIGWQHRRARWPVKHEGANKSNSFPVIGSHFFGSLGLKPDVWSPIRSLAESLSPESLRPVGKLRALLRRRQQAVKGLFNRVNKFTGVRCRVLGVIRAEHNIAAPLLARLREVRSIVGAA